MKKFRILFLMILITLLSSCNFIDSDIGKYNLSYHMLNGEQTRTIKVDKFSDYMLDLNVTKDHCTFDGWYLDEFYETKYVNPIFMDSNKDVYAKWIVDADYAEKTMTSYNKLGVVTYYEIATDFYGSTITQGTAFAFDEDDNYYYFITNNHVTVGNDKYRYIVTDNDEIFVSSSTYKDQVVVDGKQKKSDYITEIQELSYGETYDLSIFRVGKLSKTNTLIKMDHNLSLNVLNLSSDKLDVGDIVISYGSPNGNRKTLSAGIYLGDKKVEFTDMEVFYEANIHSAVISNGSSGGPLFNELGEVVGVNFAGSESKITNEFIWGASIPLDVLNAFITRANYK